MPHNLPLPTHRYVWVMANAVLRSDDPFRDRHKIIPAVWWGVSVTPNRMLGCHILLENGAMVVDVPLASLRWADTGREADGRAHGLITWDCYGWDAEIVENDFLTGMTVELLDESHQLTGMDGKLWFAIDHIKDGFSMTPAQHKHLWVVAMHNGDFSWVPQDQLLLHDKSFTTVDGVPSVKRQEFFRSVE